MNGRYGAPELIGILCIIAISGTFGFVVGMDHASKKTTTTLTHEAVREKAGTWVAGEQGEAVFKWVACQPRSAAEVIKK